MKLLELGKFYPPHRGGMESLLQSWCRGFAARGAEVECVVANQACSTVHEQPDGVRVHRLAALGALWSISLCPAYVGATRRYPADLWHAHFPNPLADLACWAGSRRTPLVLHYHSDIIRQAGAMWCYGPLLRWLLGRASRIVVATPPQIDASPWLSAYRAKCRVIPFGIDLQRFAANASREEAVAKLRRGTGGRPVLLTIGRLVGYKGHRYLLEAARTLDAVVWLVGEGPLRSTLESDVRTWGLADRVVFWGDLPDAQVVELLHACDAFVLPSITANEAFGLVQVEAMACGKPVVSCQLASGVPYVNRHGVTGLVVPPADAEALAAALQLLLRNPELRFKLGAAARGRAHTEFAETVMLDRYWDLLREVVRDGVRQA